MSGREVRRILGLGAAGAAAIALLVGTHGYLAARLALDPAWPAPVGALAAGAVAVLGALLVAQPICERAAPRAVARFVAWPAALWMGLAFWLLLLCAATDALLWAAGGVARAAEASAFDGGDGAATWRAALALGLAGAGAAAGMRSALAPPRLRREVFCVARWPRALDGFRIAQITDVHIGSILGRRFAAAIARRVNALEPDLVVVTGDLVDGSARRLADEVAPFAGLRARYGVLRHRQSRPLLGRLRLGGGRARPRDPRAAQRAGRDRAAGATFDLIGVDDHHAHLVGGGREDLSRALAGRDPERAAVLLAHDPSTFARARREAIDLQLSGHTHGGQIWPFAWFVRLATPYVAGRYRDGRAQLYVSRGTGFWGPPLRLGSPAEITEITVRAEPEDGRDRVE